MLEGIGIGDNTNRKECNEYVEAFVESQAERRGLGGNQFLQKKYWLVFRHPRSSRPELRRSTRSSSSSGRVPCDHHAPPRFLLF